MAYIISELYPKRDLSNYSSIVNFSDLTVGGSFAAAKVATQAAKAIKALIIRPDKSAPKAPKDMPGIAGYLFNIIESETIQMTADVTDTAIAPDRKRNLKGHITPKPLTITVKGYVAEVYETVPKNSPHLWNGPTAIAEPLLVYAPNIDANARRILNEAKRLENMGTNMVQRSVSLWDFFNYGKGWTLDGATRKHEIKDVLNMDNYNNEKEMTVGDYPKHPQETLNGRLNRRENRQSKAFEFFRFLWINRIPVSIETAWGTWKDMAITSIKATQDTSTGTYMTIFDMSFKQLYAVSNVKDDKKATDNTSNTRDRE